MTVCYPGSFDPVTLGHIDIITRTAKVSDKLIVAVMDNPDKKPFFSVGKRVDFLREETRMLSNVKVISFSGMVAALVLEIKADVIIRGIRDFNDFQYEKTMAEYNKGLTGGTDTWFITPEPEFAHVSSSAIREVAALIKKNGFKSDILSRLVPERVKNELECFPWNLYWNT